MTQFIGTLRISLCVNLPSRDNTTPRLSYKRATVWTSHNVTQEEADRDATRFMAVNKHIISLCDASWTPHSQMVDLRNLSEPKSRVGLGETKVAA